MPDFHIRVREPGVAATFTIKASWGDGESQDAVRRLLTEAYGAAMSRVEAGFGKAVRDA